nr:MAG TPA: hypothetical protein [Caudoviricetes sp.]
MINKKTFIFNTLADALAFKIGADPKNTTYRLGSFAEDAEIKTGEPDIPYYSEILIRETNQMWQCNQFWLNDVNRSPDNDLATERAERMAADQLLRSETNRLTTETQILSKQLQAEAKTRAEADTDIQNVLENQQKAIVALGLRVDGLAGVLITMDEYRAISPKKFQAYYVARDDTDKAKMKCWRIYLRNQLIGEFESSGKLTMPKFPMRFPFRFA